MLVNIIDNLMAVFGAVLGLRAGWISAFLYKDYRGGNIGLAGSVFFGCISLLGFRMVPAGYLSTAPLWLKLWKLLTVILASIALELFYMELQEGRSDG